MADRRRTKSMSAPEGDREVQPQDESDDDTDDESLNGSVDYEEVEEPEEEPWITVRSLHGNTDPEIIETYRDLIHPALLEYMEERFETFLIFPVILEYTIDRRSNRIPFVYLAVSRGEMASLSLDDLPLSPEDHGFGAVCCEFEEASFGSTTDEYPERWKLAPSICSGISIGCEPNRKATLGLLVKANPESDEILGITAGHFPLATTIGITQPGVKEFTQRMEILSTGIAECKAVADDPSVHPEDRHQHTLLQASLELEFQRGQHYFKPTDHETADALSIGTLIKREHRPHIFEGRTCLLDYGLVTIREERKPVVVLPWLGFPLDGYLSKFKWERMSRWGKLEGDLPVRKSGRTTGLTFGVVAGVRASCRSLHYPKETLSEFYVLRHECLDHQNREDRTFAWPGDSGAAVIDPKGKVAGVVGGGWDIVEVKMLCDPLTKCPDFVELKKRRDKKSGAVNMDGGWLETFLRITLVQVVDARMVRKHAKLNKDARCLVIDQ
jgi:hypothetical protein